MRRFDNPGMTGRSSAKAAGGHLGQRGLLCVAHLPLDRAAINKWCAPISLNAADPQATILRTAKPLVKKG